MAVHDVLGELVALEHAGWQSVCDGTGAQFYGHIMSDDALVVLANGAIMDRAAVSAAFASTQAWEHYEITGARLVSVGAKAAALAYIGTGYRHGTDKPFVGAMSSVYRRDEPGWTLVLYEQAAQPA